MNGQPIVRGGTPIRTAPQTGPEAAPQAGPQTGPRAAARATPRALRVALLAAATELFIERGFGPTRMRDIADAVGVSRQTVYNEFGTKQRLARELVRGRGARHLDGLDEALARHRDVSSVVAAAVAYTLAAAGDPFTRLMLTGAAGREDLRSLLTGRVAATVHRATRQRLAGHVLRARPGLDRDDVTCLADAVVRLTWSHLVLPIEPATALPPNLARLAARYLGESLAQSWGEPPAEAWGEPPDESPGERELAGRERQVNP